MIRILLFATVSGIALLVIVLVLVMLLRHAFSRRQVARPDPPRQYAVMSRDGRLTAVRSDRPFRALPGLFYAGAFYWGLPIYVWRYGWIRGLALTVSPLLLLAAPWILLTRDGEAAWTILHAMLLSIGVRALLGYWVAQYDARLRAGTLVRRGWTQVDLRTAESARGAIRQHSAEQARAGSGGSHSRSRQASATP